MTAGVKAPHLLERIGRYRIVRPLSKGGMALVYEARRESLAGVSPRVAIKLILPEHKDSKTFKELFINEARLGASMQHQNLVGIQDFDCEGDTWFLVMEYVDGRTLRRMIGLCQKHRLQIPLHVIAELGRQAAEGLHYAHGAADDKGRHLRLVHRDMKPSNLILNPQGVVKVLDFGISKGRLREEREGSVKGTWGYMAPEQARGKEVDPTADIFGLAVVLYELASLTPMFRDKSKDDIKRLLADDHAARLAATLDVRYARLVSVLVRALQRDPRARYPTAAELARDLSSLLPDPVTARDEVERFSAQLDSVEAGPVALKVPGSDAVPSAMGPLASLVPDDVPVAVEPSQDGAASWGAVMALLAVLLVVASAVVGVQIARDAVVAPADVETVDPDRVGSAIEPRGPAAVVEPEEPKREPIRVAVVRPEDLPPPVEPGTEPEGEVVIPVPKEKGSVVLRSVQRAEVYIGGQYVSDTPVTRELDAGVYSVSLVAPDGRRRSFQLEVIPGEKVKKTWDFDRQRWR